MPTKNIEASFRAILVADGTLSAAVGTRIYPDRAPKGAAYPHIVYVLDSETGVDTFETPSNTLRQATFRVDCYYQESPTGTDARGSARTLADAVAAALRNYSGTVPGGATIAGTDTFTFGAGYFEDEGGDFREVSRSVSMNVWFYQ